MRVCLMKFGATNIVFFSLSVILCVGSKLHGWSAIEKAAGEVCKSIGVRLMRSQQIIFRKSKKRFKVSKKLFADTYTIKSDGAKYHMRFDHTPMTITLHPLISNILSKKIIKLCPDGLYGLYDAGICAVIRRKYNLHDYVFSGASAGAWNSLFLSYNGNIDDLVHKCIFNLDPNFTSIKQLQQNMKKKILETCDTTDFDLHRIFISVCVFDGFWFANHIYTDFEDLEDAIDCCIASSNIPFITGDLVVRYGGFTCFDGGFLWDRSFLFAGEGSTGHQVFEIGHGIWGKKMFITSLFDRTNSIRGAYEEGVKDTERNIGVLNEVFDNLTLTEC